jgi:uncharacterized phage-associated protein
MAPAVRSSLDIALWFLAMAKEFGMRLQPMKLQRLLYLAQIRYANRYGGAKLMPATFLATKLGPLEPTIHHVFENGAPSLSALPPSREIESLLNEVWRRYGRKGMLDLEAIAKADHAYHMAFQRGANSEIMVPGSTESAGGANMASPLDEASGTRKRSAIHEEKPSVVGLMTMDGRRIRKWMPGMKKGDEGTVSETVAPAAVSRTETTGRKTADGRAVTKWVPGMRRSDLSDRHNDDR